jgi:hypothetical protein
MTECSFVQSVPGPKRPKKPLDEPTNNGSEVMRNARPSPKEGEGIMEKVKRVEKEAAA